MYSYKYNTLHSNMSHIILRNTNKKHGSTDTESILTSGKKFDTSSKYDHFYTKETERDIIKRNKDRYQT